MSDLFSKADIFHYLGIERTGGSNYNELPHILKKLGIEPVYMRRRGKGVVHFWSADLIRENAAKIKAAILEGSGVPKSTSAASVAGGQALSAFHTWRRDLHAEIEKMAADMTRLASEMAQIRAEIVAIRAMWDSSPDPAANVTAQRHGGNGSGENVLGKFWRK